MKNGRLRIFTLIFLAAIFSFFPLFLFAANKDENELLNSGFEDSTMSSWGSEMWHDDGIIEMTTEKVHSGQLAIKILTGEKDNDIRIVQDVQVMPNTYYRFSGWIATENILQGTMGATICLMGDGDYFAGDVKGTTDYAYYEFYIKTSKSHYSLTLAARLGFFFNMVKGVAYFDDLKFEKLDKKPKDAKILPEPEQSIPGGKQNEEQKVEEKKEQKKDPILGEMNVTLIIILVSIGLAVMAINIIFTILREKKDVHEQEHIEEKSPPA